MSEAISYYTRNKEEKSEDSGIESGNSLENTGRNTFRVWYLNITSFPIPGSDSQGESSSEHSVQEEGGDVPEGVPGHDKEDLLVCRLWSVQKMERKPESWEFAIVNSTIQADIFPYNLYWIVLRK